MNTLGLGRPLNSFGLGDLSLGLVVSPEQFAELLGGVYTSGDLLARLSIKTAVAGAVVVQGDVSGLITRALSIPGAVNVPADFVAPVVKIDAMAGDLAVNGELASKMQGKINLAAEVAAPIAASANITASVCKSVELIGFISLTDNSEGSY